MNKVIREYRKEDIPSLVELWSKTFGDKKEFPQMFFDMLPNMGSAVVCEDDGKIIAMTSVIAGQELQYANSVKKPEIGYIYAVAVDEAHRGKGLGVEITKAACDLAKKREAVYVAVLPSTDSLYSFYKKSIGLETVLYRKKIEIPSNNTEMTMRLSSTEYYMMREGLLANKTFLRLSNYAMDFERKLCEMFGGGLYASMSGICTAWKENNICYIHEMISQNPDNTASSVAYNLNCEKAVYYLPSENKNDLPFIVANTKDIPLDTVWNIAYE